MSQKSFAELSTVPVALGMFCAFALNLEDRGGEPARWFCTKEKRWRVSKRNLVVTCSPEAEKYFKMLQKVPLQPPRVSFWRPPSVRGWKICVMPETAALAGWCSLLAEIPALKSRGAGGPFIALGRVVPVSFWREKGLRCPAQPWPWGPAPVGHVAVKRGGADWKVFYSDVFWCSVYISSVFLNLQVSRFPPSTWKNVQRTLNQPVIPFHFNHLFYCYKKVVSTKW